VKYCSVSCIETGSSLPPMCFNHFNTIFDIKTNFKTLNLLVYINKCSIGSKCNLMERGNAKKIFPRKCRLPFKLSNDHYFIETCIILRAVKLCYSRMPQWIIKRGRLVYILGLGWDKTLSGPRAGARTG